MGKNLDKFTSIARLYNIGQIRSVDCISKSSASEVFIINAQFGDFILKLNMPGGHNRLNNETLLYRGLIGADFNVPEMLKSRGDTYVNEVGGRLATLSRHIPGRHLRDAEHEGLYLKLGRMLAEFHVALQNMPRRLINNEHLFMSEIRTLDRLSSLEDGEEKFFLQSCLKDLIETVRHNEGLPSGVLHGDFHRGNIVFDGTDLWLLDMQSSGYGMFILDVGRAIADLCSTSEGLDERLAALFVQGYEEVRELIELELELLTGSIQWGACCVALWALKSERYELFAQMRRVIAS